MGCSSQNIGSAQYGTYTYIIYLYDICMHGRAPRFLEDHFPFRVPSFQWKWTEIRLWILGFHKRLGLGVWFVVRIRTRSPKWPAWFVAALQEKQLTLRHFREAPGHRDRGMPTCLLCPAGPTSYPCRGYGLCSGQSGAQLSQCLPSRTLAAKGWKTMCPLLAATRSLHHYADGDGNLLGRLGNGMLGAQFSDSRGSDSQIVAPLRGHRTARAPKENKSKARSVHTLAQAQTRKKQKTPRCQVRCHLIGPV